MKTSKINIRISDDLKERFLKICEKERRSQTEQIAYWIENYKLENKEKEGSD